MLKKAENYMSVEMLEATQKMAASEAVDPVLLGERANLLEANKTELLRHLAGAMANQFNNIMMGITSFAEVEMRKSTPAQKRQLEQVLANTAQATTLIQKLLDFSSKQPSIPCKISLNTVLEEICGLVQPLVGEDIELATTFDAAVDSIVADPVEIDQLILALALNARDAMQSGGSLQISSEIIRLESNREVPAENQPAAGKYAMIRVRYIPSHSTSHLGRTLDVKYDLRMTQMIAALRSLVKKRNGQFRIFNEPGESTTFSICFPAFAEEAQAPQKTATPVDVPVSSTTTILIVEDNDAVRNSAAEYLKMEGFKVLLASNGPEALRIVKDSKSQLDLLITDIMMAGMNGNEVARELYNTHPELKVLFMSGNAHEVSKAKLGDGSHQGKTLQKPFRLNQLSDRIREVLGN